MRNAILLAALMWLITLYNDLTGKKTGEFIKHN
jgi:hypothetical protein